MSEREIDQALVERAQSGERHAFDLLVSKYQRKLAVCCPATSAIPPKSRTSLRKRSSRPIVRPQPSAGQRLYTWLYRIGINTAKNYLVSSGRANPTGVRQRRSRNF